jgi:hypothetical protein
MPDAGGWRRAVAAALFPGWTASLAALLAGMTISVVLFGFWMPYWRIADQDMILAYQGLLFNDGLAQEYFDHTGYLSYLTLGAWFRLLHWLGLLPVHALSELPAASDVAAFDRAWQHLVEAGRVLSLLFGAAFVWVYATLVRRLVGDWRIAIMGAIALAYSGGVAMHIRMVRTELLSSGLVTSALLLVLVAARAPGVRRHAMIALAGLCASLAVAAKVQAMLPALAIPMLALAFGQDARDAGDHGLHRTDATRWATAVAIAAAAIAVAYPATTLLWQGIAAGVTVYRPLGGALSGIYQGLAALWVAGAMLAYARAWRVGAAETVAAMGAVALGVGLGVLSLYLRYHPLNMIAFANPIEHMFAFAAGGNPALANEPQVLSGALLAMLAKGFGQALAMHSFVLSTSARPTLLLEWFAIGGAIVLWRRGERKLPLQVALLVLTVWGLDAAFTVRGLQLAYFVYTDPLLILAAALVLACFPELQTQRRAQNVAFGLLVVYVVWAHVEPVKAVLHRNAPQEACAWIPGHISRVKFAFCGS